MQHILSGLPDVSRRRTCPAMRATNPPPIYHEARDSENGSCPKRAGVFTDPRPDGMSPVDTCRETGGRRKSHRGWNACYLKAKAGSRFSREPSE